MILLRLTCLLAGVMVLVAPGMLFPNGEIGSGTLGTAGLLVALLLASSGFFLIAGAGRRIERTPKLRRLCALLLAAPLLAGVVTLWLSVDPTVLWMSGALLGFTLIVYLTLVYPLLQAPSAGRLRAREARAMRPPVLHHL